eukprot:6226230-Alexandrium_andersonii.AAC.1
MQAEFGQADLLDAESEVIRFIFRLLGSVNKVLPLWKDLANGYRVTVPTSRRVGVGLIKPGPHP